MDELIILLLVWAAGLTQCFPDKASQGGTRSVQVFFCQNPGCAANVISVFCNDKQLLNDSHIPNCSGRPHLNTVCEHDGQAFVSIDTDGTCEFEGKSGYISTRKCTEHENSCAFINATTPSPVTAEGPRRGRATSGYIIGGVFGAVLLLLLIVVVCLRYGKKTKQQPVSDPDSGVTEPLDMQRLGEATDSDTRVSGLDDGSSSPTRPDRGA